MKYVNIYSPTLLIESLKFVHFPNRMELTSCFCRDKESETERQQHPEGEKETETEKRDREKMTERGRGRREMELETDTRATRLPPAAAPLPLRGPRAQRNRSARG